MSVFEKLFVVEARYVDDAATARAPFRDAHLARAAKLRSTGTLALVGAFSDLSGSLLVCRSPDEEAVRSLVEFDVYWREGVWVDYTVRACMVLTAGD